MAATALAPGFGDPVRDAQGTFRTVMMAMARPGTLRQLTAAVDAPAPLAPGAGAVALALCDFETPIWLDDALSAAPAVAAWLRFHTGAPLTDRADRAHFAFVGDPGAMPPLSAFAQGVPDYPDRSTTLVVAVDGLEAAGGWTLRGPGIDGITRLRARGLPPEFPLWLAGNRAGFPLGVDVILVAGMTVAAIPRSTLVEV